MQSSSATSSTTLTVKLRTYIMPKGDPADWDVTQEALGHKLAREFAYEFIVDEDHASTMQRIGCDEPDDVCMKLGRAVHKHPLTTYYMREALQSVCKQVKIDPDNILAMLMREATDKAYGASQRGRIAALKEVREWYSFLNPKGHAAPDEDSNNPNADMPALRITIEDGTEKQTGA